MKIKKIKLHNFRNFKDLDLDFSSDNPDKKITVILGDNTYGKTTLVKAFVWCLYRDASFKTKSVLNKDVEDSLAPNQSETVKVELTLDHKNSRYLITTSETYVKKRDSYGRYSATSVGKPQTEVLVYEGGLTKSRLDGGKAEEAINSILPNELKDYFFFDGETNQIDNVVKKSTLENAIYRLMNLDKYTHLRDYFNPTSANGVEDELRNKLRHDSTSSLLQLDESLSKAEEKYNNKLKEADDYRKQIEYLDEQLKINEAELDANKDILEAQTKKKECLAQQKNNHNEIAKNFEMTIKLFSGEHNSNSKFLDVLFAYSYNTGNIQETLNSSNFSSENSYSNITDKAVDDLIRRGYCLCGTKIEYGSEAHRHLVEAKQHMEPHDYGRYVADFKEHENFTRTQYKDYVTQFKNRAWDVINGAEKEDEILDDLKAVSEKIIGTTDVGALQKKEIEMHDKKVSLDALEQRDRSELPGLLKEVEVWKRKQEEQAAKNKKNENVLLAIKYAEKVYHKTSAFLDENAKKVRKDLTDEVQSIFDSMYSGSRRITISEDYKVSTQTVNNNYSLDESTGLGTVINFSFVIGLTNLAKKAAETHRYSGDFASYSDDSYEIYPLVLDAPFSSTDSRHIGRICNAISENCDQVIIFVMEKDFKYAESAIADKIGKKYQLIKDSESAAHIKEEI